MCPKVSEAHKAAARTRILDAAQVVFAKKGYNAASVDDIVKKSGLSKGAIYGYYKSKHELFLALQARENPVVFTDIAPQLAGLPTAMAKLEAAARFVFSELAKRSVAECQLGCEFWASTPRIKPVGRLMVEQHRSVHALLLSILKEGVERGEFRDDLDPDALAELLIAVVDGLSIHRATLDIPQGMPELEAALVQVVRRGVLAAA